MRGRPRSSGANQAILAAAIGELAAQGFEAMSMDRVAKTAGVTKPTIYLRHGSKRQLALDALVALRQPDSVPARADDATENLRRVLAYLVSELAERGGFALIGSVLAVESRFPELVAEMRRSFMQPRIALLEAAVGGLADELHARTTEGLTDVSYRLIADMLLQFVLLGRVHAGWPKARATGAVDWITRG